MITVHITKLLIFLFKSLDNEKKFSNSTRKMWNLRVKGVVHPKMALLLHSCCSKRVYRYYHSVQESYFKYCKVQN